MSSPVESNSEPALRLVEAHLAFQRAFGRWAQSLVECGGNSPTRMRLLGVLNCKGKQIMGDLGDLLGVTARQVTNLVDALEAEGLVRRTAHPTDRRARFIEITPQGAEQAEAAWKPFQAQVAELFRELPEKDQRELLR